MAGALLAAVLARADPAAALHAAARAPAWIFGAPAALLLGNSALQAARLRLLMPRPRPAWRDAFTAVLLGNFVGLVTPTGGAEAAKILALGRRSGRLDAAAAALVAARAMELVPWAALLAWGTLGPLPARWPELVPVAALAGGGMVLVAATLGALAAGGLDPLMRRVPRLSVVRALAADRRALGWCFAMAFPFAAVNSFVVWLILGAYGVDLSYADTVGLIPTLDVVISLPITVSGLGVREGMFAWALAPLGVDPATALAIAATRWSGELVRSALGGALWVAGERILPARRPAD